MPNQDLTPYIQGQLQQGINKEQIVDSLVKVGWQISDIEQAFSFLSGYQQNINHEPVNNVTITEENYPIQFKWVYKTIINFLSALIISIILLIIGYINIYMIIIILSFPGYFILLVLRRSHFHYALEQNFLTIKQGVFNKQERHIPYGVIQNVLIKQDLFDRIFSLSSISIENASEGGGSKIFLTKGNRQQSESIGSQGNKVMIPGLKKEDAEELKLEILQKIKENPVQNNRLGL